MDPGRKHEADQEQPDYRIAVRFGSAVLQAGHTAIPNLVLKHYARLKVSTGELVFMLLCLQLSWSTNLPHPSLGNLAEQMSVSRRQVRTYAAGLKAKGLLNVEERTHPDRGQLSSVYDFTPLLDAVVELEEGPSPPPGKDSSEGGRKFSSEGGRNDSSHLREDTSREDKVLQTSRFSTLRTKSAPAPAKPTNSFLPSPIAEPNQGRAPQSLAEIVRSRGVLPAMEQEPEEELMRSGRYAKRPYLDSLIRGISQIFDDESSTDANIVRAHRLQERSGLDEETFTQCVFRARSLVKERRLRHRGSSVRRPGAYFFTILEDLANEAQAAPSARNRPLSASESPGADVGHLAPKRAI